jgi:hypothetical protein
MIRLPCSAGFKFRAAQIPDNSEIVLIRFIYTGRRPILAQNDIHLNQ